nr:30S ribosomal protein S20 [Angustibacter aerolatus]
MPNARPHSRTHRERKSTRGQHQVPDQAHHDERQAHGAQQGGQERACAPTSAASRRPSRPATPRRRAPPSPPRAARLDKAVSKGVIHKNQAANRKSSLAKQVSSL